MVRPAPQPPCAHPSTRRLLRPTSTRSFLDDPADRELVIRGTPTPGSSATHTFEPRLCTVVRGYGVAEEDVGFSAGSLASAYNLAGLFSGFFWGRVSDSHGRRPVLLFGLLSTGATVVWFGLAGTGAAPPHNTRNKPSTRHHRKPCRMPPCAGSLSSAIVARVVGGLLNSNQAVVRAMLRECTPEAHRARAFASLGQAWRRRLPPQPSSLSPAD